MFLKCLQEKTIRGGMNIAVKRRQDVSGIAFVY